jgi:hypothetical protein
MPLLTPSGRYRSAASAGAYSFPKKLKQRLAGRKALAILIAGTAHLGAGAVVAQTGDLFSGLALGPRSAATTQKSIKFLHTAGFRTILTS